MALFRSTDRTSDDDMAKQRSAPSAPPGQVNIIGQGTTIEGGLIAASDVRIAGRVVGHVKVEGKTVVTPEGEVEGEVHTTHADIAGRIRGDVIVEDRLVLKNTARIEGNLFTKKLVIEDGATFSGTCDMSGALPAPRGDGKARRPAEAPRAPLAPGAPPAGDAPPPSVASA
jgi:cytoskeletal protein CcmA (bactofilin family)